MQIKDRRWLSKPDLHSAHARRSSDTGSRPPRPLPKICEVQMGLLYLECGWVGGWVSPSNRALVMPYSMVRVASFGQILVFSTLERGAFLHTFLQLYTKYTLIIGSFTKKYIFGLFSENFHYFSNYGKKFMIFSQYTLSSSSCKSHLGKPTDKSWGCFEITLDKSFHSCKLHHL